MIDLLLTLDADAVRLFVWHVLALLGSDDTMVHTLHELGYHVWEDGSISR